MYVSQLLACLFSICVVFPCSLDLQNWVGFSPIASKSVFSGSGPFELEMITASGLSSQHFPIAFIDGVFVADSSLYLSLHPSISLPCFLLLENLTLWVVLLFNLLHYCHQERFFSTRERSGFFLFFCNSAMGWGFSHLPKKICTLAVTILLSGRKGGRCNQPSVVD